MVAIEVKIKESEDLVRMVTKRKTTTTVKVNPPKGTRPPVPPKKIAGTVPLPIIELSGRPLGPRGLAIRIVEMQKQVGSDRLIVTKFEVLVEDCVSAEVAKTLEMIEQGEAALVIDPKAFIISKGDPLLLERNGDIHTFLPVARLRIEAEPQKVQP